MIKEINLGGVYLSPLVGYMAAAAIAWWLACRIFAWIGLYRLVWHPTLFNLSLYVILLAIIVGVSM